MGDLCECIFGLVGPTVSEIMRNVQTASVCTNAQCFESIDDLIPMHVALPRHNTGLVFIAIMYLILMILRPVRASKSFQLPPPPPPPSAAA